MIAISKKVAVLYDGYQTDSGDQPLYDAGTGGGLR